MAGDFTVAIVDSFSLGGENKAQEQRLPAPDLAGSCAFDGGQAIPHEHSPAQQLQRAAAALNEPGRVNPVTGNNNSPKSRRQTSPVNVRDLT
jgi:hypothetical protein